MNCGILRAKWLNKRKGGVEVEISNLDTKSKRHTLSCGTKEKKRLIEFNYSWGAKRGVRPRIKR